MLRSGGIPPSLRNRSKDTRTTRPHAKEGGRRCRARPRYSTAYRLRPPPTSPLRQTTPLGPVIVSPSLTCLRLRSVFAYARFGTPSSGFRDNRPSPPASRPRPNTRTARPHAQPQPERPGAPSLDFRLTLPAPYETPAHCSGKGLCPLDPHKEASPP